MCERAQTALSVYEYFIYINIRQFRQLDSQTVYSKSVYLTKVTLA
jgi:hypothetical protein